MLGTHKRGAAGTSHTVYYERSVGPGLFAALIGPALLRALSRASLGCGNRCARTAVLFAPPTAVAKPVATPKASRAARLSELRRRRRTRPAALPPRSGSRERHGRFRLERPPTPRSAIRTRWRSMRNNFEAKAAAGGAQPALLWSCYDRHFRGPGERPWGEIRERITLQTSYCVFLLWE